MEDRLADMLDSQKARNIVYNYDRGTVKAAWDPRDPRIVNVSALYSPVWPIKWIPLTFRIRVR